MTEYLKIEPLDTCREAKIMVGFSQLENVDKAFANKLSNVVNGKGAFAKFKSLIRNSRYEDA